VFLETIFYVFFDVLRSAHVVFPPPVDLNRAIEPFSVQKLPPSFESGFFGLRNLPAVPFSLFFLVPAAHVIPCRIFFLPTQLKCARPGSSGDASFAEPFVTFSVISFNRIPQVLVDETFATWIECDSILVYVVSEYPSKLVMIRSPLLLVVLKPFFLSLFSFPAELTKEKVPTLFCLGHRGLFPTGLFFVLLLVVGSEVSSGDFSFPRPDLPRYSQLFFFLLV